VGLFTPLFEALNACGARYGVVGRFAVLLHGHIRFTADVDLVVDLDDIRHLDWIRTKCGRPGSSRLKDADPDDAWRSSTWEGAREAHLEAGLVATPAQRSEWLEESLALLERVSWRWKRTCSR
jgi:hypothetical protein